MHHRLLIAAQVVGEVQVLLQSLPDPSHIAVAEDAKAACEERVFAAVARYVLDFQELDDGLSHRQSSRHGFLTPVATILSFRAQFFRAHALRPSLRPRSQLGVPVTMLPEALRRHKEYCNPGQSVTRFL